MEDVSAETVPGASRSKAAVAVSAAGRAAAIPLPARAMAKAADVDVRAVPGHQSVAAAANAGRSATVLAALRSLPRPTKLALLVPI